jgi:hypothetical protein
MPEAVTEVDPGWLTATLRRSGALPRGEVLTVAAGPTSAHNSHTVRLQVSFSDDVHADVPRKLVLKRNTAAAWSIRGGQAEVAFYELVARSAGHPPVTVQCLASGIDRQTGDSFLLLADLSDTHQVVVPREVQIAMVDGIPPDAQIMTVIDTLARLQAYWWEQVAAPLEVASWCRDEASLAAFLEHRTAACDAVFSKHADWLPPEVIELYRSLLRRFPGYWERKLRDRMAKRKNLTLVHGDAYFNNFLAPIKPGAGPAYLIDWQSPSIDIGASDLVNMCATWWTSAQRKEADREERILRRYHSQLLAAGVSGYTLDDVRSDYAGALIDWVMVPVQDAADGSALSYWWPKMQCLISAYRDWDCELMLDQ